MKTPHNTPDPNEQRRMILAVLVSLGILLGFHFMFEKPQLEKLRQQQAAAGKQAVVTAVKNDAVTSLRPRAEVVSEVRRIPVKGSKVEGSLSLKGGMIDDVLLTEHYATLEKKDHVALLSPAGTRGAEYVQTGWISDAQGVVTPGSDTVWTLAPGSASELSEGGAPVRLMWNNGHGLTFERVFSFSESYLFNVTERVTNATGQPVRLHPYRTVSRTGLPADFKGFFILHEGPLAYIGGELKEPQYKDLMKGKTVEEKDTSGWIGITDKYWMVTILPKPGDTFNARVFGSGSGEQAHFQTDAVGAAIDIAAGQAAENTAYIYAGVKNLTVLKSVGAAHGFEKIDLAIDFGMWYLITKPFYAIFHFLVTHLHNIGLAILAMTLIVRAAVFPLTSRAYVSMAKMKKVAPKLKEIQEKHADDKAKMQMEIFELYKRENANPFSGCWPMLVQIPIFFALYKVILISVDLRHAPFWGWIHDLSAPDPTSLFNAFGVLPWTPPHQLMIGAWPVLFCLTMIFQKRLSPPMADPVQEKIQTFFPYLITVMMAQFASGLVIYWTWSNTLAILQQYYISNKIAADGEKVSLIFGHHERRKKK